MKTRPFPYSEHSHNEDRSSTQMAAEDVKANYRLKIKKLRKGARRAALLDLQEPDDTKLKYRILMILYHRKVTALQQEANIFMSEETLEFFKEDRKFHESYLPLRAEQSGLSSKRILSGLNINSVQPHRMGRESESESYETKAPQREQTTMRGEEEQNATSSLTVNFDSESSIGLKNR
jgi:hypothetical protein